NERVNTRDRFGPGHIGSGPEIRCTIHREVRNIRSRPLLAILVPPQILFAFAPRFTFWIRRSPVIQYPTVCRPSPCPLGVYRCLVLLGWPACRLVHPVGVDAGINPAPTFGCSIGTHLCVRRQMFASVFTGQEPAVNFSKHCFWIGVAAVICLVIPREI